MSVYGDLCRHAGRNLPWYASRYSHRAGQVAEKTRSRSLRMTDAVQGNAALSELLTSTKDVSF